MYQRTTPIHINAECVYVGIDVSKTSHVACFISRGLLARNGRFEKCPSMPFPNTRKGFENLLFRIKSYTALENCAVVMERTGHYHRALQQYLLEQGVEVYEIHLQQRLGHDKTDKRDAAALGNMLYNQIELRIQVDEAKQRVHSMTPISESALALHGLVRRRHEVVQSATRCKNRLIAISDEAFPEFVEIFHDPYKPTALRYREHFPMPSDIVNASMEELMSHRGKAYFPSKAGVEKLQLLAKTTIGVKEPLRKHSLGIEQQQLIAELRLLNQHLEVLDSEIETLVSANRQGQIINSMPGMGTLTAAMIIASIGNIENFESAAKLKAYFGWAPQRSQTGTSKDNTVLTRNGQRQLRYAIYLVAWRAVQQDSEWKAIYDRLVPLQCRWDAKKKDFQGKNKVMGRICGQIVNMIYAFLKRDSEILKNLAPGQAAPEPLYYNREIHRNHRLSKKSKVDK